MAIKGNSFKGGRSDKGKSFSKGSKGSGKSFGKDNDRKGGFKKSYGKDDDRKGGFKKSFGKDDDRSFGKKRFDNDDKPRFKKDDDRKGGFKKSFGKDDDRSFGKKRFDSDNKPRFKKDDDRKGGFKKSYGKDDDRSFGKKRFDSDNKPRFKKDDDRKGGFKKSYGKDDDRSFGKKRFDSDDKPRFKKDDDRKGGFKKSYGKDDDRSFGKKRFDSDDKPRFKKDDDRKGGFKKSYGKDDDRKGGFKKSYDKKDNRKSSGWKKDRDTDFGDDKPVKRDFTPKFRGKQEEDLPIDENETFSFKEHSKRKKDFEKKKQGYDNLIRKSEKNREKKEKSNDGLIRLNKFISNSGVCSRRDADQLIESGAVKVNGVVVTELGTKIKPTDKVQYGGQSIKTEQLVYIALNKPKDYITTMDDPEGRKTVMSLIRGACKERVYPVGRLDRNTTGIILFTNDGELTRRLTHPKFLVSKMYHVTLDKNFAREDFDKMKNGLELEDGFIKPDQLEFTGETKKEIGIEIHSGRNRIVRRMFEHLDYEVTKLDRVQFAGLTKKDIPRGKYRFLNEKEVGFLKML